MTAVSMVQPGKGILAADESTGTIEKKFRDIGVPCTEETRREWRGLLFETQSISEYISGVILFEETLQQETLDGVKFVDLLTSQGIIPGVKVDKSTHLLAGSNDEVVTEGLDGLRPRLEAFRVSGARFTKWRAVFKIGRGLPSDYAIDVNSHALARFASLSQEQGLVPIVEPEVLLDGNHSIEDCYSATKAVLESTFEHLHRQHVALDCMVLKPNMVLSGKDAPHRSDANEVAKKTIFCFLETVPKQVPGIAFLSGGQSDEECTMNLDAINVEGTKTTVPWELTYSFSRGLLALPLKKWNGSRANIGEAQKAFEKRGRSTALARVGKYQTRI